MQASKLWKPASAAEGPPCGAKSRPPSLCERPGPAPALRVAVPLPPLRPAHTMQRRGERALTHPLSGKQPHVPHRTRTTSLIRLDVFNKQTVLVISQTEYTRVVFL